MPRRVQYQETQMPYQQFNESLQASDLSGRISNKIHIDEFSAKMGDDADVIVTTFKVFGKNPANDLERFLERGYNWILDAETSPGEVAKDEYLVFVECPRRTWYPEKLISLFGDLSNLTEHKPEDWQVLYFQDKRNPTYKLNKKSLNQIIPLSPRAYKEAKESKNVLESMLNSARISRKKGDIDGFTSFKRTTRD